MQYGLNNNLGSANSITDRTQSSSFVNKKNISKFLKGLGLLESLKNSQNGSERLQSIITALLSGKS